ncbi:MAG: SIS domain-containing protein [Bacteroidia bacterium]|nr:SIS domain-containing protein [Bacteroidia bacterium]
MQLEQYSKRFSEWFSDPVIAGGVRDSVSLLKTSKRVFFLGNGGSNAISSHMMEDYGKIAGLQTYAFSDAALITCYANDYGYENAMAEWLKLHFQEGDVLIATSSSGESKNIVNAASVAKAKGGKIITLTGFGEGNTLSKVGNVNFYLNVRDYGMVECFHQVILHVILDSLNG